MGKVTGFLEHKRQEESYAKVDERLGHYREFVVGLAKDGARIQATRCMDCGTPFCSNGCPVNNVIPDFNDLVYQDQYTAAGRVLHSTNNFPEITGRICPAPCEAACTLNINDDAVGIKSIERTIADRAIAAQEIAPQIVPHKTGKQIAVVGSGPSGLAAAQQLARAGHAVTVFEKNDRLGGLLRYGIPDFKLEKTHIDLRIAQMQAEGVTFRTGVLIGNWDEAIPVNNLSGSQMSADALRASFDAVLLCGGAELSRDLRIAGRELQGVHFAMEFLPQQNRKNAGDAVKNQISAAGKRVVVIGGGDTGSDCVGTSLRQGAISVTQLEVMPQPPIEENRPLTWPFWPLKLRTSSSHEEGCERSFAVLTKEFLGESGQLTGLKTVQVHWQGGQMQEVAGSESILPADLVFLAMGFVSPVAQVLESFGVNKDPRGNALATTDGSQAYASQVPGVFVAGDIRRGQSLVVWAIREGRQAARAVDEFLMGKSTLPR